MKHWPAGRGSHRSWKSPAPERLHLANRIPTAFGLSPWRSTGSLVGVVIVVRRAQVGPGVPGAENVDGRQDPGDDGEDGPGRLRNQQRGDQHPGRGGHGVGRGLDPLAGRGTGCGTDSRLRGHSTGPGGRNQRVAHPLRGHRRQASGPRGAGEPSQEMEQGQEAEQQRRPPRGAQLTGGGVQQLPQRHRHRDDEDRGGRHGAGQDPADGGDRGGVDL